LFSEAAKRDPGLAQTVIRAYNDWHLDAWVGSYPDRFIACSIPILWDAELAAEEVRRVAEKGCHAVTFSMNPYALGYESLHSAFWDPFWRACEETETIVCMHIGSDSKAGQTSPDAPMNVRMTCSGINIYPTAADLIWAPVFQKFPGIKVALAEGGIGWIPYFLERADDVYQRHNAWTRVDLGGRLPSEVFKEHIITCFVDDEFGIANLDRMNVDMVAWECDYPHSDGSWPRSPEKMFRYLAPLGDDAVIDKITHGNAIRLLHFDPMKSRGRDGCTVGFLRQLARGHDISIQSKGKKATDRTVGALLNSVTPIEAGN
jgi:predicted TIM-barrel fold metal-dependent hydrolase